MKIAAVALLFSCACSTLVERSPPVCQGTVEQCAQSARVIAWWTKNTGFHADVSVRWKPAGTDLLPNVCSDPEGKRCTEVGLTWSKDLVEVTSDRALCHELRHVQLWRTTGNPCKAHAEKCGWTAALKATESACKDALTPVAAP